MHVYEVIHAIYKFYPRFFFKTYSTGYFRKRQIETGYFCGMTLASCSSAYESQVTIKTKFSLKLSGKLRYLLSQYIPCKQENVNLILTILFMFTNQFLCCFATLTIQTSQLRVLNPKRINPNRVLKNVSTFLL